MRPFTNLHASRRISADDRKGRERLLRYFLRPPISNERLAWRGDGRISLRLKRPYSDGTTHFALTALELTERCVPLVFPPGFNRIRYSGFLAPAAKLRARIAPSGAVEVT